MPPRIVPGRHSLHLGLAAVLAAGVLLSSACTSTKPDSTFKEQKAYGAEMARKGFWREALFRFEKAASLKPDDAQIQNDLGVAYEGVGETVKALTAYKRALELAPEDQMIRRNYARFAEYYTSVQRAAPVAPAPTPQPTPPPR